MEKALAVSNGKYEMFLGDGLITRIAYENILPSAVVGMFSQSFEQANVKDR